MYEIFMQMHIRKQVGTCNFPVPILNHTKLKEVTDKILEIPREERLLVLGHGRLHPELPSFYLRNFKCFCIDIDPETLPDLVWDARLLQQLQWKDFFENVCLMNLP